MRLKNIGDARSVNEYVKKKLERFDAMGASFESLFELMFSEENNIISETYYGLKVVKKTYGECKKEITAISDYILSGGIPGLSEAGTCGIYMGNSILWIEVFWALIISGIDPLLLNLMIPREELSSILVRENVDFVICDSADAPGKKLINAVELLGNALSFASSSANNAGNANGDLRGEKGFARNIILMTSGTSRNVKLCCFDAAAVHDQISYSFEIIRKNKLIKKHYRGELKHLCFLPFYHIFGLVAVYVWFAFYSRTFVFLRDLRPDTLLDTVRSRHVTHVFAVPLFWDKIYESAVAAVRARGDSYARLQKAFGICRFLYSVPLAGNALGTLFSKAAFREVRDNIFGGSISFMISGGGDIRPEVLRFFNYIGYRLVNGYGMTETGISCVELRPAVKEVIKGSVGRPLKNVYHRIGSDGILRIKGDIMARVIIEDGVRRENTEWFKTNDLAREENGYYFIEGRADDVIILPDGENLNPAVAEKYFADIGFVNYCIVRNASGGASFVGQTDKGTGPDGAAALREKVKERAAELSLSSRITEVVITHARLMPENDFKVSRAKIREKLSKGEITDISDEGNRAGKDGSATEEGASSREGDVLAAIAEVFAEALDKDPGSISPEDDFFRDLAGNSLDYYQMIRLLEERFHIEADEGDGRRFTTCLAAKEYIESKEASDDRFI